METEKEFQVGQRVTTPHGEGEIVLIVDHTVKVKLDSGMVKIYSDEKISDDSDAG